MMKKSMLLMLCLFACGASAQEVYKCLQDGKLTISSLPCPPGAISTVVPVEASPRPALSPEEELARMKQKADALERERLNREATQAATTKTASPPTQPEATEAVNAHGRLNAARKRNEEQKIDKIEKPDSGSGNAGGAASSGGNGDSNVNTNTSGKGNTGSTSGHFSGHK
jgi:hypothetical protein